MMLQVCMRCGCVEKVDTDEAVLYGDEMICDTHGSTAAVRVEHLDDPPEPILQALDPSRNGWVETAAEEEKRQPEGVQPRRPRRLKQQHAPDTSGIPARLREACGGDLVQAGRVYAVVRDVGRDTARLRSSEARLRVSLDSTEILLNRTISKLAAATDGDQRIMLQELYRERDEMNRQTPGYEAV